MRLLNLLAAAGALALGLALGMPTCTVQAAAVTLGAIDVTQSPYNANSSGTADDTSAFQRALNAAAGTGTSVRVPAGQYKFAGSLSIPDNVTLEGVNDGERTYSGDVTANRGTVFLVTGGAGKSTGPAFLTLHANSSLRNAAIYYPAQPLSTAAGWTAPKVYPPTLNLLGRNGSVENVCGINPYSFILSGSLGNTIRRVTGHPLFSGLSIENDADITGQSGVRVEDVHFFNIWDSHPAMATWTKAHSTGFVVYRADELAMRSCSCSGYQYGFRFDRSPAGSAYGTLTSCSAAGCTEAIHIAACASGIGGGLVFDGGGFGLCSSAAVSLAASNTGNVTFNSCRFFQSPGALVTNASAAGSVVSFLASSFDSWGSAAACIYCGDAQHPSAAGGKTRMLSCSFDADQFQYACTSGEAGVLFENNSTVNGVRVLALGVTPPSPKGQKDVPLDNF